MRPERNGVIGKYFGALFCVIGHMFPVFYGFKGGKGILCSGTLLLLLDWRIALVGWGAFVVLWLTTRCLIQQFRLFRVVRPERDGMAVVR